ncbi:BNR-4 repeat-containing protein [uncultured Polaribacter sp.]|uniref:BNR-4 repeat-containing protein n=1 Tax=uncultured Polaribacter sp. TaxID=174711 RepID=UPI00260F3818|nr:BNR-4 repeat-containing protein [uncultured Polaribacter sp.]
MKKIKSYFLGFQTIFLFVSFFSFSQVTFEKEVKITDIGLHFNGSKVTSGAKFNADDGNTNSYDYYFGTSISAKGDCLKTYGDFVFMTWYRGGESDRYVMLTRYNTTTGKSVDIEFPHRHTGFQNKPWIGESHNTIAVAISPLDGTIHLLYDMHAYGTSRPSNGSLSKDYFRYSYSVKNAASLSDENFTLDKFVKNSANGYKHLSLNSGKTGYPDEEYSKYAALTYPQFFTNDLGDIFMYMREGGNNNGAYKFSKYDTTTSVWSDFTHFNVLNAKSQSGITHNWGLYGNMKYVNGKIRIGFQRRSANNSDKYLYQNGVYYAYSDNQSGADSWKNHSGESFTLPLYDADKIKVMEPGDYVNTTQEDQVYIVGNFDWTVTQNGDVHIISKVQDRENNVTKSLHTYKPAGASDFITTEDFAGGTSIYTAGDDVFIIGLKNNRIFVQKTQGGTNKFTTVYQATSGRSFDHGRVHIANGKLYYYLMEKKSGNAQPLYLQIIDLDIVKEPFRVSITAPENGQKVKVGETIAITADAVNENGSISKVEFKIDDTLFETATSAPYKVDWIPSAQKEYKLQAIAYNQSNESVTSTEITVTASVFNPEDLTEDIYRLRNVATGKFLTDSGAAATPVTMTDSGIAQNTHWTFVESGSFVNIDSETYGVLRGPGAGFAGGAYRVVSTGKAPPTADNDKVWQIHYNASDETYRFQSGNSGRFLYTEENGNVTHIIVNETDNRSKWKVIPTSQTLSIDDNKIADTSINIYPNPANNNFTIAVKGINKADIKIYNLIGKLIYQASTDKETTLINNFGKFKSGIYLVRVIGDNHNIYNQKLIIE